MLTFNPFNVRKIGEKIGKSAFFKVESLRSVEIYRSEQPLFITTMMGVCRKKNGVYMSPLLTVSDVTYLQYVFHHSAAAMSLFSWTLIATAMLLALIPLLVDMGLSESGIMFIFWAIHGSLLLSCFWQMYLFRSKAKKAGDRLWDRGAIATVPAGCRKKVFVNSLKLWAGPVGASVLSEVIDLSGDEEVKLVYESLELGAEVIRLEKKI